VQEPKAMRGIWWFPDAPDKRYVGDLLNAPGRLLKLKLIVEGDRRQLEQEHPVIFGIGDGGADLTLHRLSHSGFESNMRFSEVKFSAGKLWEGAHLPDPAKTLFKEVQFHLQYLREWFAITGFKPPKHKKDAITLKYARPKKRTFTLTSGWEVSFNPETRNSYGDGEQSINEDVQWIIKRDTPFTFEQALSVTNALQRLIHFACLKQIKPTNALAEQDGNLEVIEGLNFPNLISVSGAFCYAQPEKNLTPYDFIYSFVNLENRFAALFQKWLRFCDKYRESLSCYDNTVYFDLNPTLELVALTQALESYHAEKVRGRKRIHFQKRILSLLRKHHKKAPWAFKKPLTKLSLIIRDNRNFYTHHDPENKKDGRVKSGTDLAWLNESLTVLVRLCVLSELGITTDSGNVLRRHFPERIVSTG
jgi:hypothetical protein